MAPVITLLTDFGYQDGYVGVMKGVITSVCPAARLIDLTHAIPHQNIAAARFTLLNAYPYFPAGTVHLVVVDPGVGTMRRAIAVETAQGYLVGPDNGVLSGVIDQAEDITAVALTNADYWRVNPPSATFHGRDLFAPAAAHLAAGVCLTDLGDIIAPETLVTIAIPESTVTAEKAIGYVQHIDHFGNIITTLPASILEESGGPMQVGAVDIPVGCTYGDVEIGHAIALGGSHGWVEIAVNGSSAQQRLRLTVGDEIQLRRTQA